MTENLQLSEGWTTYNGSPVYWLAPEFWTPTKGLLRLLLPGETAHGLTLTTRQKRVVEFLKLQGDPRYCDPETAQRMKRMMVERLGTNTPWRGVPPADFAALPDEALPDPTPECPKRHAQMPIPFG